MVKPLLSILLLASLSVCDAIAQDAAPDAYQDSLQRVIDQATSATAKTEALLLLGEHLVQRSPKQAEEIANELKREHINVSDSNAVRRVDYIFAASHRWQGDYATALNYYRTIYQYSKSRNDSLDIAKSGQFIGSLSTFIGDNVTAQHHLIEAAGIYAKIGSPRQNASIQNSLAGFYLGMEQTRKAEEWYLKALEQFSILHDSAGMANVNANLGMLYTDLGEYEKAEQHLYRQRDLNSVFPTQREMGFHYDFLGKLRQKEGKLDEAYQLMGRALRIRENLSSTYNLCESKLNVGGILIEMGRYAEAIQQLDAVFDYQEHQSLNQQQRAYELLATAHEKNGNLRAALDHAKSLKQITDSIYTEASIRAIAEKDALFNTERHRSEIELLNKEKEISGMQLKRSRAILYSTIAGLLLLLVVAGVFYWLYLKIKSKNSLISKTLKERELLLHEVHHRVKNNLQTISSLLNLQSKYVEDKKAFEALQAGRDRVQSMAILHKNLYTGTDFVRVDMQRYFEEMADNILKSYKNSDTAIRRVIETQGITMEVENAILIGLIVNELLTNVLKHAFPGKHVAQPEVSITMQADAGGYLLSIRDNGVGMPASKINATSEETFGQRLVRSLSQKLRASIQVSIDNGTLFTIRLPEQANAAIH